MNDNTPGYPPKKKKIWLILLIVAILAIFLAIALTVIVLIAGIIGLKVYSGKGDTYSYADRISRIDMSKKPDTVAPSGGVYDYTFINDLITEDTDEADKWIKKYYPGSTTDKVVYSEHSEWWTIKSQQTPMRDIAIDGYVYGYDYLELNISDGYVESIKFVKNGSDMRVFNEIYNELESRFGSTNLYVADQNSLEKFFEPQNEYMSYSWYENDFDGFYSMSLTRAQYSNLQSTYIMLSKY